MIQGYFLSFRKSKSFNRSNILEKRWWCTDIKNIQFSKVLNLKLIIYQDFNFAMWEDDGIAWRDKKKSR